MTSDAKPGWVCPTCGRRFARTNQRHTCKIWTVDDLTRGLPQPSLALYQRFVDYVAACGPFEYSVTKQNIGFRGPHNIFAGVYPIALGLFGYLHLPRQVEDGGFWTIAPDTQRLFIHRFTITSIAQYDEGFATLIAEAYAVGQSQQFEVEK